MKTAISLPDDVFRAAERVAKRKGMTRSELYARAVAALVRAEDEEETTEQLNALYGSTDSRLEPELARLPSRVVEREDW